MSFILCLLFLFLITQSMSAHTKNVRITNNGILRGLAAGEVDTNSLTGTAKANIWGAGGQIQTVPYNSSDVIIHSPKSTVRLVNPGTIWDEATGIITVPAAGTYNMEVDIHYTPIAGGATWTALTTFLSLAINPGTGWETFSTIRSVIGDETVTNGLAFNVRVGGVAEAVAGSQFQAVLLTQRSGGAGSPDTVISLDRSPMRLFRLLD